VAPVLELDDHGWVTNDPELICMVGYDNPACGRACLPLSEWAPLCQEIASLKADVAALKDRLEQIRRLAT